MASGEGPNKMPRGPSILSIVHNVHFVHNVDTGYPPHSCSMDDMDVMNTMDYGRNGHPSKKSGKPQPPFILHPSSFILSPHHPGPLPNTLTLPLQ